MRARFLTACAAAALAVPALAQAQTQDQAEAQPNRYRLEAKIPAGERAVLAIGRVPRGEFRFGLRASSDGEKRLLLTQQRNGGRRFTVLALPGSPPAGGCQGAAGSIFCTGITTPATPGGRTWTFRLSNRSNRQMSIALTIVWRKVAGAR
jgi:hypothetical protein